MTAIASPNTQKMTRFTWTVVVLLALAMFINYLDRGNLATAGPSIKDDLQLTNTQFGVLISAFFWIYVPAQLFAAWLVSKINAYRTLVVGLVIWSLSTMMMGAADSFLAFLALRVILGLGESASFPATSKLLAQNLPVQRLGLANAMVSAGIILGPAVGTFVGGLLIAYAGWRPLFVIFGGLSLLWLLPWLFVTRSLSSEARRVKAVDEPPFRALLRRRELWAASIGHFANNYSFYTILSWLPLYLVKAQGYSLTEMAQLGGLVYVLTAVISLAAGATADYWMARGASSNRVRKTFIGSACVISVICMLMCASGDPKLAVAGLLLSSLGFGMGGFNLYAISQTLAGPVATAKWVGIQNCIGNMSGIVAPILTGMIVDATGQFNSAFVVAAIVSTLGFLCWTVGIRRVEPIRWI
jgi:MFS family permease